MSISLPEPDQTVLARRKAILRDLTAMIGSAAVVGDADGLKVFETDALTCYRQTPLAVVLPQSTSEVSALLAYASKNGIKIVPRGAGTSLCGGALPLSDSIVVGLSRMIRIIDIDYLARTARVEAGITNLAISAAVASDGFFYAPDPSSQLACTIGGNIAMNSGGAHCLKYGVTVNNLLGVKMVLMDGSVVEIGGKQLESPGYDLLALIAGSEGQLGIVTEATVRLMPMPAGARPMLIGFDSCTEAGACVASIIAAGIVPVAIEFMDKPAIEVCESFAHAGYPLDVEALLIVEVEGSEDEINILTGRIREIANRHAPKVFRASGSAEESLSIWKGRKAAFGAMGRISDYMCMDGVIPLSKLPEALIKVGEICARHGFKVANIFHAGDGNLHPLILYNSNDATQIEKVEKCGADILKLCVRLGGCLTGEHGVGIEKRDLMRDQFTPTDLDQMIRIKTIFDPDWLLNPAKVFPLDARPTAQAA